MRSNYNLTSQDKIYNFAPHCLRHTGYTRKAEAGIDLYGVIYDYKNRYQSYKNVRLQDGM